MRPRAREWGESRLFSLPIAWADKASRMHWGRMIEKPPERVGQRLGCGPRRSNAMRPASGSFDSEARHSEGPLAFHPKMTDCRAHETPHSVRATATSRKLDGSGTTAIMPFSTVPENSCGPSPTFENRAFQVPCASPDSVTRASCSVPMSSVAVVNQATSIFDSLNGDDTSPPTSTAPPANETALPSVPSLRKLTNSS